MKRILVCIGLAVLAVAVLAGVSLAQSYPAKPIRLLVPQAPGGGNDTIARMIGQKISVTLKQQVIVENRAGAGGVIAADLAAKAAPDGYTLLLGNVATMAIIPNMEKKAPYDPVKDFQPVSLIAQAPLLIVVHPSVQATSVAELVALAKSRPNQLNYASNGVGSSTHLATELFKVMTGVQMKHIPYKGLTPAMTDLLKGDAHLMFSSAVAMMPHVKAGKLRGIATTGSRRSPGLPDMPTVAEAGVADYEAGSWYGIVAPAGTPRAVVDVLSREVAAAAKSPDVAERLTFEGVVPVGSSPEEFATHIQKELARMARVVKAADLKTE